MSKRMMGRLQGAQIAAQIHAQLTTSDQPLAALFAAPVPAAPVAAPKSTGPRAMHALLSPGASWQGRMYGTCAPDTCATLPKAIAAVLPGIETRQS